MTDLVFDIESNGLLGTVDKVHCITTMPLGAHISTLESFSTPYPSLCTGTLEEALERLLL